MALSRNEIKEKLTDIIQMVLQDRMPNTSTLTEDSELVSDMGLNSVGVLYLVIAIEEFFGIEFKNVGFGDFKTIGDVLNYIEEQVK